MNNKKSKISFCDAIRGKEKISVIAEIKRRSPSRGDFPNISVKRLINAYVKGGAVAVSVVTEPLRFNGSLDLLRKAKIELANLNSNLPILRKDFISSLDEIEKTAQAGISAVLLIAKNLDKKTLRRLIKYSQKLSLDPVVEIHDEEDLAKMADENNVIIGINNRDLAAFHTNVKHARSLLDKINPKNTIIVESGFSAPSELSLYAGKIDAVLMGTCLLTSPNILKTLLAFTNYKL